MVDHPLTVWVRNNLGIAPCRTKLQDNVQRLDVRDLVDRKGNDPKVLLEKIETGTKIIQSGKRLVVCCDLGISRSAAVSIGILTMLDNSFDASVEQVAGKVRDQSVNLDLLEDVRDAVQHSTSKKEKHKEISGILLLGSSGFIGKALKNRLSHSYHVHCPKSSEIDLAKDVLALYREGRNDEVDLIVDLAHPSPRNSIKSLGESVLMIRNVLEASRVSDKPLIFFSSIFVYDGCGRKVSMRLGSELRSEPASIYGQSKALCEDYIRWYRDLYGLKVTTLRPTHVYGMGMDKYTFLWKFITNALAGKTTTVHRYLNGFQKFDLLHIDDLLDATCKAIALNPSIDINIGTGKAISALDVAKLVSKLVRPKSEIRTVNVKDYVTNLLVDTQKSSEVLKWQAKLDFADGLKELLSL